MGSLGSRFRITQNAEMGDVSDAVFLARVHDDGLPRVRTDGWPTSVRSLGTLGQAVVLQTGDNAIKTVRIRPPVPTPP